ncbi:hypothetical protein GLA29479_4596 [Lysobacter antibioticus]|nr:hypothetical protein GLA29479_4596 [Lysobacter antibioticus]
MPRVSQRARLGRSRNAPRYLKALAVRSERALRDPVRD